MKFFLATYPLPLLLLCLTSQGIIHTHAETVGDQIYPPHYDSHATWKQCPGNTGDYGEGGNYAANGTWDKIPESLTISL